VVLLDGAPGADRHARQGESADKDDEGRGQPGRVDRTPDPVGDGRLHDLDRRARRWSVVGREDLGLHGFARR
jgi:hypothetical protein